MMMNDGGEGEKKKRRGERRKRGEREGLAESQDVRKQAKQRAASMCECDGREREREQDTLSLTHQRWTEIKDGRDTLSGMDWIENQIQCITNSFW